MYFVPVTFQGRKDTVGVLDCYRSEKGVTPTIIVFLWWGYISACFFASFFSFAFFYTHIVQPKIIGNYRLLRTEYTSIYNDIYCSTEAHHDCLMDLKNSLICG